MFLTHKTTKDYFYKLLKPDQKLKPSNITGLVNQNLSAKSPFVFFNCTDKEGSNYLLEYTFVFPSNVLLNKQFFMNERTTLQHKEASIHINCTIKKINSLLRCLYKKSLQKAYCKSPKQCQPQYSYMQFQDVFIADSVMISEAQMIIIPNTPESEKLKKKIIALYPNMIVKISQIT